MTGTAAPHPDDLALVRVWFDALSVQVRAVDYTGARPLFAEDMLAFGTYTDFVTGRDHAEANQWRRVWPTIEEFRWRLGDVQAQVSPDRLFAVGMAVWDSVGHLPDGTDFDRRGRATVAFTRAQIGAPWIATHTHMSLFRGTPDVSHGDKPETGQGS